MSPLAQWAAELDTAALNRQAMGQLSARHPFDVDDAYRVQRLMIERRLARGERLIGAKLGFTSHAKMQQMGVHDVIWGRLTDAMLVEEGGELDLRRFIHPRVEPEVAFLVGERLAGSVSVAEALAAVKAVAPALEIIDSRYAAFRFNLADVVADNCSSAGVVLGPWRESRPDLANLGVLLELDGRARQYGSSAAILGHPAHALVTAARLLAAEGLALEPGSILLAGGATAAEALAPGMHVRASIDRLGTASFHCSQEHDT